MPWLIGRLADMTGRLAAGGGMTAIGCFKRV